MTRTTTKATPEDQAKHEINVAHRMLKVWENQMPIDRPLSLSPSRKATLNMLFRHVFSSSLGRWEEFVSQVASSKLLSRKFSKRNTLFKWATTPENCLTILEGIYSTDSSNVQPAARGELAAASDEDSKDEVCHE